MVLDAWNEGNDDALIFSKILVYFSACGLFSKNINLIGIMKAFIIKYPNTKKMNS